MAADAGELVSRELEQRRGSLTAYGRSLGLDGYGVEDALQDTAIGLLRYGERLLAMGDGFAHLVTRVFTYTCISALCGRRRELPEEVLDAVPARGPDPAAEASLREDVERTLAAVGRLHPKEKDILLAAAADVPYRDLENRYGWAAGQESRHVFDARQRLRRLLGE